MHGPLTGRRGKQKAEFTHWHNVEVPVEPPRSQEASYATDGLHGGMGAWGHGETSVGAERAPRDTNMCLETPVGAERAPRDTNMCRETPICAERAPRDTNMYRETPICAKMHGCVDAWAHMDTYLGLDMSVSPSNAAENLVEGTVHLSLEVRQIGMLDALALAKCTCVRCHESLRMSE